MNARLAIAGAASALLLVVGIAPGSSAEQGGRHIGDLREATARYHDLDRARADGFVVVTDLAGITCINSAGVGGMGTHYVLPSRLLDGQVRFLEPEILLYDGDTLVGVEYVVLADDWHAAHGKQPPKQLGKKFQLVGAGNRYGLPDFYEQHVWLWKSNPAGLLEDWNPDVDC